MVVILSFMYVSIDFIPFRTRNLVLEMNTFEKPFYNSKFKGHLKDTFFQFQHYVPQNASL